MQDLQVAPVWLAASNGSRLAKGTDGVLILRFRDLANKGRIVILSRINPTDIARPSFSSGDYDSPIQFASLTLEWWAQGSLIQTQQASMPSLRLEPNGAADMVVSVRAPAKEGVYDLRLLLNNQAVAFNPCRNNRPFGVDIEWAYTLTDIEVASQPINLATVEGAGKLMAGGEDLGVVMMSTDSYNTLWDDEYELPTK